MKKQIIGAFVCLLTGVGFTACVDNDYDLSKDIDMTMQLGTEGLQLKIGSTDSIMLSDILEIDDEEMIEETAHGEYYLIKDGNTNFDFDIPKIETKIDIASLIPDTRIFDYDDFINSLPVVPSEVTIPAGQVFGNDEVIGKEQDFNFKQNDVPADVVSIKSINPSESTKTFRLKLGIKTNNDSRLDFSIQDIRDFKITLPYFIKCVKPSAGIHIDGNILTIEDNLNINSKIVDLGSFQLDRIEAAGDMGEVVQEVDNQRFLTIKDKIAFEGKFSIKTNSEVHIQMGDYAQVEFDMTLDGTQAQDMVNIVIDKVTGIFDPLIDPVIDPINISKDLPDFLNDDDVTMDVTNPTIRFDVNMNTLPVNIDFFSELRGYKNLSQVSEVRVPGEGRMSLTGRQNNTLYFFQGDVPFDPHGIATGSSQKKVPNLSDLVKKIPDEIRVDLSRNSANSEGHIQLKQDELQTIELGKRYAANAMYTVYVPFQFNKGLKVVYKDSTDSFENDLADYEAVGAAVTANIINTIPLNLIAKATPVDKNGNEISSIKVTTANISACQYDENGEPVIAKDENGNAVGELISLEMDLSDPAALKIVDRINIRVEANGTEGGGMLNSKQFLIVKDLRLKLKGAIIADLN